MLLNMRSTILLLFFSVFALNIFAQSPPPPVNYNLMLYSGFGTHTIKKDYRVLMKIEGEPGYFRTRVKNITKDSVFFRGIGHVPLDKIREIGYFSKKDKWVRYSSIILFAGCGLAAYQYSISQDKTWLIPAAFLFAIPTYMVLNKRKTYRIPKPWSIDIAPEKTANGEVFFR